MRDGYKDNSERFSVSFFTCDNGRHVHSSVNLGIVDFMQRYQGMPPTVTPSRTSKRNKVPRECTKGRSKSKEISRKST